LFLGLAYLCRETVLLAAPVYFAIWLVSGRLKRPRRAGAAIIGPLLIVGAECLVYFASTGRPFYRWAAILAQQRNAVNQLLVGTSHSGGTFLTDPALMLVTSQEFGLYHVAALAIAIAVLLKRERVTMKQLAVWLLVGFGCTYYAPTSTNVWVSLQRDPRYAAWLTTPSALLVSSTLVGANRWMRWTAAALLLGAGAIGIALDQGNTILKPHNQFLRTPYAQAKQTALEPFEYVGARWQLGLPRAPEFYCLTDGGRSSVVRLVGALPGALQAKKADVMFVVLSPQRRPDLLRELLADGWVVEASLPGSVKILRRSVGLLISLVESQRERARRIMNPPGLLVLRNSKRSSRAE
jgi:hypothetical protein